MAFDTLQFFLFFIFVYCLYFFLSHRRQNRLLLAASAVFYALSDPRLLFLLAVSSGVSYLCAARIEKTADEAAKKRFLLLGLAASLGVLAAAKLLPLLISGMSPFTGLLTAGKTGISQSVIVLLGVSFFTLQTASYVLDVYRGRQAPVQNFMDYSLYASFFPLFMAGPIERAGTLVPQILEPRRLTFDKISAGVYLLLWGFFQKLFIADNLGPIAAKVFFSGPYDTFTVLGGLYAFAFYLYALMAGYANIGRGAAKLLGFDLMPNFDLPYFSSGLVEFWRRWNMSLSLWLKEYVYLPLGGSARGPLLTARNLSAAFLLGSLWYGMDMTFILWGCYYIVLICAYRLFRGPAHYVASTLGGAQREIWLAGQTVLCFHLVAVGWIFFASSSLAHAGAVFSGLFYVDPASFGEFARLCGRIAVLILPLFLVELFQKLWEDQLILFKTHWLFQGIVYFVILFLTVVFGAGGHHSAPFFIY